MCSMEFMNELIKTRRDLHKIPEIALNEYETSKYIRKRLQDLGFLVETVAKTGLMAYLENNEEGKAVCFRADMDGLNIREETGSPFASSNSNMHACGHDAHMAILLGLARYISDNKIRKISCCCSSLEKKTPVEQIL